MESRMITLNNGYKMPVIGYGTWKSSPVEVIEGVRNALSSGYRHLDCAAVYDNEKEIGKALNPIFSDAKSNIKRDEVFITSKIFQNDWGRVEIACRKTLADLQLSYLDLYLVHAPVSFEYDENTRFPLEKDKRTIKLGKIPFHKMWKQMEKLVDLGLVRSIGLSNFPMLIIHDLLCYAKKKPVVNQIEIHPYLSQHDLASYCLSKDIAVQAYSPLANGQMTGPLGDSVVNYIAQKHSVTPAQVLIRWIIQLGYCVLPKSVTPKRIIENFKVFDYELSKSEMKSLSSLERNGRTCDFSKYWNIPFYS